MRTGNKSDMNYNDLIIRFLNGEVSEQEVILLRSWVNQSAKNREEFIQMKILWMASAQIHRCSQGDLQKDLLQLESKIGERGKTGSVKHISRIGYISKIAAAILLFILIGAAGTYMILKNKIQDSAPGADNLIHVYTPKGSKAITILPDGTKVWLNAGTDLMYHTRLYGKYERQVTLIGEGFFKVLTNPDKPFIVNAKNLKIRALGTEFNVKAYPEEDNVETTIVKGIVKVDGKDSNRQPFSVTLKPNQQVKFRAGKAVINSVVLTDPGKVDIEKLKEIKLEDLVSDLSTGPVVSNVERTELYTSWKDEDWIFKGEKISELAVLLERRFNVKIYFSSEELKEYRFTGTFQNETLEQVLQVLKLTAPLQYEIGKGTVTLKLDSKLKMKYYKYINSE
jgi:ferric-dicitrate binding protein FerR (iron transport regulator)